MASKPMNPKRKQRMILILFLMSGLGVVVGLAMFALSENINLFYNPTQIAAGEAPENARIRVGGMVVDGSVKRDPESLQVAFDLTDYESTITVTFNGILPDLFREGQGIVALGKMSGDKKVVEADEVLAKHDENYMPPEVADALEKAHQKHQGKMPSYGNKDGEKAAYSGSSYESKVEGK